ncbi:hypothetical protein R4Z10_10400 [Niallia sp. XMNu-256]|uniref:hypothetical protein n=1 Tax=Niallia sp. XMNu-256 TaxID=3082444 RepID=UPI0030D0569B
MGIIPCFCELPSGIIVMWSGSINEIPEGWLLCDGTNGTPDLRDRFVMGTNNDAEIGQTGGNNTIALTESQLAPHTHTGTSDPAGGHTHTGTTNNAGTHTHVYIDSGVTSANRQPGNMATTIPSTTNRETQPDGDHNHNFTTDPEEDHTHNFTTDAAGDGEPINILNPYYKLAFIMKS